MLVTKLGFPAVHVPTELLTGVKFRAVERLREVLELVG